MNALEPEHQLCIISTRRKLTFTLCVSFSFDSYSLYPLTPTDFFCFPMPYSFNDKPFSIARLLSIFIK